MTLSLQILSIGAVRKINNFKYPSRTINYRNYTKYDHQKFRNDVSEIDWSPVNNSNDVNVAVTHFNSALRKSIDSNAPLIEKRVKGRECKWLNAEIKSEMNARDQLHRKAQKSAKGNDWSMYKKQRNKCNNLIKKAKATYHRNLIKENATNSRKFWDCIKAVFPSKSCRVQTCSNIDLNRPTGLISERHC